MRAILSVSDKAGLVEFAQGLAGLGWELFSTGGTQRALEQGGVAVAGVSRLTGFPEILDGRVKTLHPAVHAGILARRGEPRHRAELAQHGLGTLDLIAVNLYPFLQTVARPGVALEEALENIDIGGPTLIRAAAKNFPDVIVVVDPSDYSTVLERLRGKGLSLSQRRALARKAFQHCAVYDTAIARYLGVGDESFPEELSFALRKAQALRYGENPHQQAAFYREVVPGSPTASIATARQVWGKELSFNNILDADAAWTTVVDFPMPSVAIVKHTNPCGLAHHASLIQAYRGALAGDPVSAFGGIVACNVPIDGEAAQEMAKTFFEIIIAPGFSPEALKVLQAKKDLRLLQLPAQSPGAELDVRRVTGGFLVQTPDMDQEDSGTWKLVTSREPSPQERPDMEFAWKAVRHIKSNAIAVARGGRMLGMGAGQPNRVNSVELALKLAGAEARGAALASDAFFPFPDSIERAASAGITAIVEPGGSLRDSEVIAAAERVGISLLFTGKRHFRH
ncbi:MAG: bifunctional phosphoribosylaminoimidazolecarboxamide formyltransferase/IMP cyclohydrolase [Chloroflexi bacterium]|nr:bifunctional phosphoribosylaminoimidazolecarboxamide formyltransferase/IMP cyclohydrolase [Chloroflexota bacterium]